MRVHVPRCETTMMTSVFLDPTPRTFRIALSLIVAAGVALVGPARAQQPTFQTTVNFVDVDVTVTDESGEFVTGLTPDDFEVFEDAKPQTIQTFSYIELPVERPIDISFGARG